VTALQAFQAVAGVRNGTLSTRFLEICRRLDICRLDYWRNPSAVTRALMTALAYDGLVIYQELPQLEDYSI
jgi:hypothetical protein